jgi:hypothetical protein
MLHDMKYFKVAEHEMDLYRMYSASIIKFPIFKWFYIPAVTMIPSLIPISNVLTPFQTPTRFSGYIRFSKRRLQYLDRCKTLSEMNLYSIGTRLVRGRFLKVGGDA